MGSSETRTHRLALWFIRTGPPTLKSATSSRTKTRRTSSTSLEVSRFTRAEEEPECILQFRKATTCESLSSSFSPLVDYFPLSSASSWPTSKMIPEEGKWRQVALPKSDSPSFLSPPLRLGPSRPTSSTSRSNMIPNPRALTPTMPTLLLVSIYLRGWHITTR